ncbi:MAG: ATP-dependent helicase [Parabacteroides sp.]|nr:ATP-dependent helicase [Parabacteroides sp.]
MDIVEFKEKLEHELTAEQERAVYSDHERVLIFAGPGTGKTFTLTARIAFLIMCKQVKPSDILALTFTQKAAAEMRNRIAEMVENTECSVPPMISTFHSFAYQLIRDIDVTYFRVTGNYKPTKLDLVSEDEQKKFMSDYNDTMGTKISLVDILKIKSLGVTLEQYVESDSYDSDVFEAFMAYQKFLDGKIDYEDLLLICKAKFNATDLEKDYIEGLSKYKYILVDEYQDTNPIQDMIIDLLLKHNTGAKLFVVGDDDQAIYGFRGSDPGIMLGFESKYASCEKHILDVNYRSQKNIVKAANQIISYNQNREQKNLIANSDKSESLELYQYSSLEKQAEAVGKRIQQHIRNEEYSYSDFAVLVRNNSQTENYERVFASMGIPYIYPSLERIMERRHMEDIISYLRVASGEFADADLLRVINRPKRSIGQTTLDAAAAYAKENNNISLYAALTKAAEYMKKAKATNVLKFVELIEKVRSIDSIEQQIELIIAETKYKKFYNEELGADVRRADYDSNLSKQVDFRIKEMEHHFAWLMNKARIYDGRDEEEKSISKFIKQLLVPTTDDTTDIDMDAVNILTMHRSKGLEWKVTFVDVNVNKTLEWNEEENRVFYVACTRGQDKLILLNKKGYRSHPGLQFIPRNCFDECDDLDLFRCSELGINYSKGMKVEHEKYGTGVITDIEDWHIGNSILPGQKLQIAFENGIRTLYKDFTIIKVVEEE